MGEKTKLSIREASGAISLVILILFVQTIIFVIQPEAVKEQIVVKADSLIYTKPSSEFIANKQKKEKTGQLVKTGQLEKAKFKFDPNSATLEKFVELGLTKKQAAVIIKYREKGGVFRTKEDLQKIYVLPDGFYNKVKDSIFIDNSKIIENSKNTENSKYTAKSKDTVGVKELNKERLANLSIELNEADSVCLLKLPGIGPYYAGKIIEYRKQSGGLISANQLMEIKGIDSARYLMFAHMVFADTLKIIKKDLNEATINELSSNPYIGSYVARSIVRFREVAGKEGITLATLVFNKIIAPELLKKLNHYFN